MIVAGIGCRHDCRADAIVALVRAAATRHGTPPTALAAPAFKQSETGLHEAARLLALPLLFVDEAALERAQAGCATRSETVMAAVGLASIAEACALAAAGARARLVLPRIAAGGATCALAAR